jgi:hypothetical protein
MFRPHICSVISADERMQLEMELLIKSIETIGNCKDYYFTLFSHEKITSKFLKDRAKIVQYNPDPRLKYPWWVSPRWTVECKGDFLLQIDSDVIVINDMKKFLSESVLKYKICGSIGLNSPFENSFENWNFLFNACGVRLPEYWNTYRVFNELPFPKNLFVKKQDALCPFYINHGVIALPVCYQEEMKSSFSFVLNKIHNLIKDNYWFPQIVTAIAVEVAKIPFHIWPIEYNCLKPIVKTYEDVVNEETIFYHYSSSRGKSYGKIKDFIEDHPKIKISKSLIYRMESRSLI